MINHMTITRWYILLLVEQQLLVVVQESEGQLRGWVRLRIISEAHQWQPLLAYWVSETLSRKIINLLYFLKGIIRIHSIISISTGFTNCCLICMYLCCFERVNACVCFRMNIIPQSPPDVLVLSNSLYRYITSPIPKLTPKPANGWTLWAASLIREREKTCHQ